MLAEWCGARNGRSTVSLPPISSPAERVHHRNFEDFFRQKRRQDRGQARREHRFAGPRRPDHQQVVAACRGDFESALGRFLTLDVAKIGEIGLRRQNVRLRPRQRHVERPGLGGDPARERGSNGRHSATASAVSRHRREREVVAVQVVLEVEHAGEAGARVVGLFPGAVGSIGFAATPSMPRRRCGGRGPRPSPPSRPKRSVTRSACPCP